MLSIASYYRLIMLLLIVLWLYLPETIVPTFAQDDIVYPTLNPDEAIFPDVPDTVAYESVDWLSLTAHLLEGEPLRYVETTVTVDVESLLPVPIGILERGQIPALDSIVRWEAGDRSENEFPQSLISGILLDIVVPDDSYPNQKELIILTQTTEDYWVVMKVQMPGHNIKLVPMDRWLNLTTSLDEIPYYDPLTRLSEDDDRIYTGGFDADLYVGEAIILPVVMQDAYSNNAGYINWRANYLRHGIKGETTQEDASDWESEGASILEIMQAVDDGRLEAGETLIYAKAAGYIIYQEEQ